MGIGLPGGYRTASTCGPRRGPARGWLVLRPRAGQAPLAASVLLVHRHGLPPAESAASALLSIRPLPSPTSVMLDPQRRECQDRHMFLAQVSESLLASPHVEAIHVLHDIRKAVEVVLIIVFIVGLIGFVAGRVSKRRR
jgi:hypothetical protein